MSDQTFSELNEAESAWLASLLDELVAAGIDLSPEDLSQYFDNEWGAWAALAEDARPDPSATITRIGAGVGAVVAERLGFGWGVVTDEYGSDLAIRGEIRELTFFPISSVAKRWMSGDLGWIVPFVNWAITSVEDARSTS
ncbi:hypothetical protein M2152_000546 [Microbacteriaceae bacterium SG_E_30_P1]|uniref:DUF3806 domain-containing protein n=1 Tax=Antiquaquibacter oligotrophicus TaxID=2880260 RepID=A0ABT6KKI4_9MICO|nr:DUF3806 domain-containing protein [Antiquaquibacter oligotrophicus]MDH6180364.1 hypothetical protein [Antiquaquibacter oligotrophicus]UDF13894.1 DUF3806 domain-containing protein [Antiquaquibacter oligotrophicus]